MPQSVYYEILVGGELPARWAMWFEGLAPAICPGGETLLAGWLPDQAVLRGVLDRLFDLNLRLLSVRLVAVGKAENAPVESDPANSVGFQS